AMVTTVSSHSGMRDRRVVRRPDRSGSSWPGAGPRDGVTALRGWSGSFIAVILSVEPASHREPARASGHTTRSTCPTTRSRGIIPPPGAPSRDLESVESARLSPRTNMRPSGTCRSKLTVLGATVSGRYGSLSAVPSMVSRPCSSQQATRSPPVAMTRLTQNLPSESAEGAKKPEPSRTTMSPRWAAPLSPRSARITSPGCRAGCMEAEGTVKGWTTKWRTRPAAASTWWGRRRPVSLSRVTPGSGVGALLPDAGLLAGQATQVVELGAAHIAAGDDFDLVDGRGVDGEHTLHADAEGDLADTEG